MNKLIFLLFILISYNLSAQHQSPEVRSVIVEDSIFYGEIDNSPIRLYLKFHRYSPHHSNAYSVKGWYYHSKSETSIPLTGLYDLGELVLYHFADNAKSGELLNFVERKGSHTEDMTYYRNLAGYDEKFVLSDSSCTWTNKAELLNVTLQDKDFAIRQTHEFLLFENGKAFDLHNLGGWNWNFKVVASHQQNIILEYEHPSKLYHAGRCAAGTESGFVLLEFDNAQGLLRWEKFILESCLFSIEVQQQKQLPNNSIEYRCENFLNSDAYVLVVDFSKAEITQKVEE